jgi:NADH-quinone oxidoreductase subunit N
VILVGTALSALLAGDFGRRERPVTAEALALMLLSASGMMLLAGARDLVLVFLGIELTSIPVYVLAGLDRRSARSAEAALKYFLLGAFSTAFLLYGVALVFGADGVDEPGEHRRPGREPGAAAGRGVLAGRGLRAGRLRVQGRARPFHMWTPDVYEGAPTPFTAFMASAVKAGAFAAFARVFLEAFAPVAPRWHAALWWVAAVTMVGGNVVALAQRNVKRMLAYSSIAHAGYLTSRWSPTPGAARRRSCSTCSPTRSPPSARSPVVEALGGSTGGDAGPRPLVGPLLGAPEARDRDGGVHARAARLPDRRGMGFFAKWYVLQAALGARSRRRASAVILVLASVVSAGTTSTSWR